MQKIRLNIEGMSCHHCVMRVENALKEIDGVEDYRVDLEGKSAEVTCDEAKVDKQKLAAAVKEAGYEVVG